MKQVSGDFAWIINPLLLLSVESFEHSFNSSESREHHERFPNHHEPWATWAAHARLGDLICPPNFGIGCGDTSTGAGTRARVQGHEETWGNTRKPGETPSLIEPFLYLAGVADAASIQRLFFFFCINFIITPGHRSRAHGSPAWRPLLHEQGRKKIKNSWALSFHRFIFMSTLSTLLNLVSIMSVFQTIMSHERHELLMLYRSLVRRLLDVNLEYGIIR